MKPLVGKAWVRVYSSRLSDSQKSKWGYEREKHPKKSEYEPEQNAILTHEKGNHDYSSTNRPNDSIDDRRGDWASMVRVIIFHEKILFR